MALPPILITGASGFLGSRLLERIQPREFTGVTCSSRALTPELCARAKRLDARCVIADYPLRVLPDNYLNSVDTLIHLAATTGKARSHKFFETNFEYSRDLLDKAARCGVRNVLFISSIAAKYKDVSCYPYARSKQLAEAFVATCSLRYAIIRPTLIAGRGSKVWAGLVKLASFPFTPIFGDGTALLQPIDVDDLIDGLLVILRERLFTGETYEFGGPEKLSIKELLHRIRRKVNGQRNRSKHLPYGITRRVLAMAERLLGPILPLTAGQLSLFAENSTAESNTVSDRLLPNMKTIDDMITRSSFEYQT